MRVRSVVIKFLINIVYSFIFLMKFYRMFVSFVAFPYNDLLNAYAIWNKKFKFTLKKKSVFLSCLLFYTKNIGYFGKYIILFLKWDRYREQHTNVKEIWNALNIVEILDNYII